MDYSRFYRVYDNIPESFRSEIIAVIDDRMYSWDSVNTEITNNTMLGKAIFEKLIRMGLI
jgi:hypothetical protein